MLPRDNSSLFSPYFPFYKNPTNLLCQALLFLFQLFQRLYNTIPYRKQPIICYDYQFLHPYYPIPYVLSTVHFCLKTEYPLSLSPPLSSMTPLSLNPPAGPSMQGQNHLFNIPPNNQDSSTSSLSCRTLFNILDRRQTLEVGELRVKDQQGDDGSPSSKNNQVCNSSFNVSPQPVMEEPSRSSCDHNLPLYKVGEQEDSKNGHGSAKWMPSKMRLMRKMMMRPSSSPANNEDKSLINTTPSPRFQNQGHSQRSPRNNSTGTTRVCSDCNTSTTPLWRSGPNGPKSLCNACGIRQRKARRAMAEAANGLATSMDNATSTKTRVHNKEKKSRTGHFTQLKNKCKSSTTTATAATASSSHHQQGEKKKLEYFKNDFAISLRNNNPALQQVFPRDEVAEAALLLMDLSCGFVHF